MKMNPSVFALASMLALVLSSATGFAEAKQSSSSDAKSSSSSSSSSSAMYSAGCPSPCDFHVESRDRKEVAKILKEHAREHHQMDVSDKDAEAMVKPAKKG
jgi:predicted small metal-binding protein